MNELSGITHAAEHAAAPQDVLSSLARAKALFQLRQIAMRLGVQPPTELHLTGQGVSLRIGDGGEETLIHSGGNAS